MSEATAPRRRHLVISPREVDLVRALAMGLTEQGCADHLGATKNTVKKMADTLRFKLGVRTRREIPMAYWRETGDDPFPGDD